MSRRGVSQAKQHPETKDLIVNMIIRLREKIERNNDRMVEAIYEGMNAKTIADRPDHVIRQAALANQIKLLGTIKLKQKDAKANIAVSITELYEALN